MKKLTVAAAVLCTTIAFSYCKKENIQAVRVASTTIDQAKPSATDFITEPHSTDKSNLGQADIN